MLEHFGLEAPAPELARWKEPIERAARATRTRAHRARRQVRAARGRLPVGLRSAAPRRRAAGRRACEIDWIDSESLEDGDEQEIVRRARATPTASSSPAASAGAASRARSPPRGFAREQRIPYLGICLGMQVAVAEFARHVAGMEGANSTEFDIETPYPVIDLLPEQKEVADLGGTMRLGADPIKLHAGHAARWRCTARRSSTSATATATRSTTCCASACRARGPARLRHLARRAPRRGDRARRAPVLRRLAVPPRVQVAPRAPRAAVPRLRRGRAASAPTAAMTPQRARRRPHRRAPQRAGAVVTAHARASSVSERRLRGRRERRYLSGTFAELCRIESPSGQRARLRRARDRRAARARRGGARGRRRRSVAGSDCGNLLARVSPTGRGGSEESAKPDARCCCARTSTRSRCRRPSSRCSSTAAGRTPTTASSAPTTRPPWPCCSRSRATCAARARPWTWSCCSRSARSARSPARARSTPRACTATSVTSSTTPRRSAR